MKRSARDLWWVAGLLVVTAVATGLYLGLRKPSFDETFRGQLERGITFGLRHGINGMYFYSCRGATVVVHSMDPYAPDYRLSEDAEKGTFAFSDGSLKLHFENAVPQNLTFAVEPVPAALQSGLPTLNGMPVLHGRIMINSVSPEGVGVGPMTPDELKPFGLPDTETIVNQLERSAGPQS